jgi:magnesium transporter
MDLLTCDDDELITDIMDENVITVNTLTDKEEVAQLFDKYDVLTIPVLDREDCIVGIVTVDDAIDVIQEEAEEDFQKMAAIAPTDKPYLKTSVWDLWKVRIPWLLLLMLSATFTSMVLSHYESNLALIAGGALYAFVPMLMGTAGNAGNQTSVTIIRAIALGEVEFKSVFRVILKELLASLLLGLTVGVVCFLKLWLIDSLYNQVTIDIAIIVSAVLVLAIVMAKLVGCLLPLVAKKFKLDPAVVASPLMTTIVDVLSLIIYCTISIALIA